MEDLIKRTAAIKWFEPYADRGLKIPIETVIQNLKDIPSAEHLIYEEMEKADIEAKAYAKGFKEGLEARAQGEWLHVEGRLGLECSKCGKMCNEITLCEDMVTKANWKYCPQCGSRMKGADDATSD